MPASLASAGGSLRESDPNGSPNYDTTTAGTDDFIFKSTSDAIRGLSANALHLEQLVRAHVGMGDLRFEALCHGVASSLQEVALRLVRLCEAEGAAEDREEVLAARRDMLDCASAVALDAGHPCKVLAHLGPLTSACRRALALAEAGAARAVSVAAEPALAALDLLEKSSDYACLFRNVKRFGSALHGFLELASSRSNDLRSESGKARATAGAETIRKLLPVVIQSLRESLRRPMNSHARSDRAYFFRIVKNSVRSIVSVFDRRQGPENCEEENVGRFVHSLDVVLGACEDTAVPDGAAAEELGTRVEWMVKFSLAVAAVSDSKDEPAIVSDCHTVVKECENLKQECLSAAGQGALGEEAAAAPTCTRKEGVFAAKGALKDAVEGLEQDLNNSLLKLIIELFCQAASPLDELIHRVLHSTVGPPDRRPEDLEDSVSALDEWSDLLFRVSHFSTFCTNDRRRCRDISSSLGFMQELEGEMVPACLKLYFNPEDQGARSHLRSVRSLWLQEVEIVERNILGIVDSTAFCYVIHEEARVVAAAVKKEQYNQDRAWLRRHGAKLVKMCQRAVDFAWKDATTDENDALPDDHPIVKVERSTWEVQGALRLVLANVEDLNLHKTMIRRMQVLVTCLGSMAQFLLSRNVDDTSAPSSSAAAFGKSKVRVLMSVSRITIGQDSKMTVLEHGGRTPGANVSRAKAMSFRSVQRKESVQKRRRQLEGSQENGPEVAGRRETLKKAEETIPRLAEEANSACFPFKTRKAANNAATPLKNRTGAAGRTSWFDFTEIFDELSALSKEISNALESKEDAIDEVVAREAADAAATGVPSAEGRSGSKEATADVSLRKIAFKNNVIAKEANHTSSPADDNPLPSSPPLTARGVTSPKRKSAANSVRSSPNSLLSTAANPAADEFLSPIAGIHSPERLRDIKTLDAKLAAIKCELEGTES